MAKRNKAKVASKSRKSALRVEALEQRQLLAAVTGGGTEVGSNIQHPNGNVYDQVLMTGSSVTVDADAGQVTRVSFLDAQGDIVQAEFAGAGTLNITLDDFVSKAAPANYNQPGVEYVTGNATFTIQGSDANTNFSVFSVGPRNAFNADLFAGGKTGGNNIADVQALVIVNNPQNPGGFTNFGGIRAGNAVFSADSGNVGITGVGVNVQGPVIIGDIDASDVGVPVLNFGGNSQFNTLIVSGGDLVQTNQQQILGGSAAGIKSINFTSGATSAGSFGSPTADIGAKVNTSGNIFTGDEPDIATLDVTTAIDIAGKTQAQINELFSGRTFTNAVTVTGDLAVTNSISAAAFRGGVTFTGALAGTLTAEDGIDSLNVTGDVSAAITSDTIGDVTIGGDLSSVIRANSIGNVSITGDLSGTGGLTTDVVTENNAFDQGEGAIGNVSVTGNISNTAFVEGVLGIGNITVGGNITSNNTAQGGVFVTRSGTSGDSFLGNIGTLDVTGDVDQGGTGVNLINIANNGTFGNVTVGGAGAVSSGGTVQVGIINVSGTLGTAESTTGTISITETEAAKDVAFGGITIASSAGSLGAVTFTGGGAVGADFDLDGAITATGVSASGLTVTGFGSIDINSAIDAGGSTLTLTTVAGTDATNSRIGINATIGNLARDLGAVTLNAGTAKSSVNFNADITADDLSTVDITAATTNMNGGFGLRADRTAGAITITGAANLTRGDDDGADNIVGDPDGTDPLVSDDVTTGAAIDIDGTVASLTITGATALRTVSDASDAGSKNVIETGSITGVLSINNASFGAADPDGTDPLVATGAQIFIAGDLGSLVLNGTTTMTNNTVSSIVLDNGGSATDEIGSITGTGRILGSTTAGVNDITASKIGDINITGSLTQDQTLITDLSILAAPNGNTTASNAETVALDGSNLSSYGIGNVTIASDLSLAFTGTKLFQGDNTFAALGAIGNISITGDVSGAQQSRMFDAATDSAWFAVGDVDGLLNTTAALGANVGRDADGDPAATDYTDGTVTIGNVTVSALQSITTSGYSGVDNISGAGLDAGASTEGFAVLSGVRVAAADGDLVNLGVLGASAVNAVDVDAQLDGTIGNVLVSSNNAVGFLDEVTLLTLVGTAQSSAILAATDIGTVQSVAPASGLNASGEGAIIGDVNATVDDTVEDPDAPNQIVVLIV